MRYSNDKKTGELSPRAEYLIERHGSVWLVWLLLLFINWTRNSTNLLRGELTSNDDYMRMVEVRDWLGGQNWFDMHQYRLNPVDPLYSHWSRISDVLIGGPIKILTPLFGAAKAELITVIAYPSILLLIFLYLASALTGLLIKNRATAVITAFMLALSFGALSQFGMGRIDHHGLQIVMALATIWFLVTSENKPKNMIFAGILCGLGLYVGIESAPYVAAACIAVVLIWVFGEDKAAQKMRYFGLSLAVTTVISLLLSAPPSRWFTPSCDALSVVYTQLTLAIAMILWGLGLVTSKPSSNFRKPLSRFLLAGALGSIALAITIVLYPHCLKGPYAGLDSRLVDIWLTNVSEAANFRAFFLEKIAAGVGALLLPFFAAIGYVLATHGKKGIEPLTERTMIIFVALILSAGLIQTRLMSFAAAISLPLAAYFLIRALQWANKFTPKIKRVIIQTSLIIALAPVTLPLVVSMFIKAENEPDGDANTPDCYSQTVLGKLAELPTATALTQIDLGAPILKFTNHSVTSAPYHRNSSGILAALDMFIEDEQTARNAVTKMQAEYVVACRTSNETEMMLKYGPDGMLARLIADDVPDWLEKIDLDSDEILLVYRVKPPNLNNNSR